MAQSVFRRRIHPAIIAVAVVVFAVVGVLLLLTSHERPDQTAAGPSDRAALPSGSYPIGPLPVGTPAPALEAAGWLNGKPAQNVRKARLVLVDIWSGW